jgi:hypothetical protein
MKRNAVILMVAAFLGFAGTSSAQPRGDDAKTLAVNVVKWNLLAQYGRIWQVLHPRYQQVAGRTLWQSCKEKAGADYAALTLKSVKALDSYPDTMTLPLLGKIKVQAVTLRAVIASGGQSQTVTDTVYFTKVGGQWKGLWTLADYKAYSHHRCPPR